MSNLKQIYSFGSGDWIKCAWCVMHGYDRQGFELHKYRLCEHRRDIPCVIGDHVTFVFCSDRHLQYFKYSHVDLGNLPPGLKTVI